MNPTVLASAVIFSAVLLLSNIESSSALKCYVCAGGSGSGVSAGCTDWDFDKSTATESSNNCKQCVKSVASSDAGSAVTRTCQVTDTCPTGAGNLKYYCCNDADLCNGAARLGSQLPLAVALLAGVALAARRLL